MFGWLFLTPAYSDDPLSVAAEEIAELNEKVTNLTEEADTRALINIAEDKYDAAVASKSARDSAYAAYNEAVEAETTALSEKTTAQSAVDGQTVTVATALEDKNDAQDVLDIANINLQTTQSTVQSAGNQGLEYTVYTLLRNGSQAVTGSVICTGIWNSNLMNLPVCGYYEDIIVKFTGKITVPSDWTSVYFAGYTDDGFRMYVDGNLAVDNWVEQGSTWSPYSPVYDVSQDKTLDVEIWWYNGGGPGSYHLGWSIPGGWTGAGCAYTGGWGIGFSCNLNTFSYGVGATQSQIDAYNAAVTAQATAQTDYNTKLATYNTANSTLTTYSQTLTTKTNTYNTAVTNTANALAAKNNTQSTYDQSIINLNNAIDDAWELYNETWQFEEQQRVAAAIAAAMANQPQPTPDATTDPTPEPSPEPSPEQTEPDDSTPTPDSETTDEPTPDPTPETEPTDEPSPEPSPQPSDIDQEPTPEPEPTPAEPSEEPSTNTITEETANLIADLTSKDTLTKLTPEQKTAVAEGLGIRASEIAKVAALAATDKNLATALEEFGDRIKENASAPMPYTLADATTEVATEAFLSDPIGAIADIDFEKLFSPSEWGKDMTDDQREKAQEVVVPVIIAGNIVAAAMTRRI
jgi:outer membrane biosynthesis protein TonB